MAYAKKDMSGALFQNSHKEQPSHSDWNGDIKIGGQEYWINGWNKQTRDGDPYISISLKPKKRSSPAINQGPVSYGKPVPRRDMDDDDGQDIPF